MCDQYMDSMISRCAKTDRYCDLGNCITIHNNGLVMDEPGVILFVVDKGSNMTAQGTGSPTNQLSQLLQ